MREREGAQEPRCARSGWRRGAAGFYLVVAATAGMRAEAVGVATALISFPSHLTVCTIRGIGLTKYGPRTFSELSFPGLVPRPSWRPRISACYRVHDWRKYAARLPSLLPFDFGSSVLEGPARQVFPRPKELHPFFSLLQRGSVFFLKSGFQLLDVSVPPFI